MPTRKLQVEILGDSSSLQKAFRQSEGATNNFGSSLGRLAKYGALAAGAAGVGAVYGVLRAGIPEFVEAAKVAAQTGAVIKSTGGAANVTAGQVDQLANSLLAKSGVDDEAIKTGENMLLTFTKIKNEAGAGNDVFNQTAKVVLDMDTAMSHGNVTAENMAKTSILVGKALNDPIKGVSALRRVGVDLDDGQKKLIATMVKSGNTMGAQKVILAELNKEFGGSAAAMGDTLPGKINILKESFNNLAGSIVGGLAPAFADAVSALTGFVTKLSAAQGIHAKLNVIWEGIETVAQDVVGKLWDAIAGHWERTSRMGRPVFREGLFQAFKGIDWGKAIGGAIESVNWGGIGQRIKAGMDKASDNAGVTTWGTKFGTKVQTSLNRLSDSINRANWQAVGAAIAVGMGKAILATALFLAQAVPKLALGFLKLLASFLRAEVMITAGAGKTIGAAIINGVVAGAQALWGKFSGWAATLPGKIKGYFSGAIGWLKDAGIAILQGLWNGLRSKWDAVAGWLGGLGGKIKSLKGPVTADAAILVPAGKAIMGGLHSGMTSGWQDVQAFLSKVGNNIVSTVTRNTSSAGSRIGASLAGVISASTTVINRLQSQLNGIADRQSNLDRSRAVRDAGEALGEAQRSSATAIAEARKKGEGVAAAERAGHQSIRSAEESLAAARQAIVTAGVQKRLDTETAFFDKLSAAVETRKAKLADAFGKLADFAGRAFAAKTQKMLDAVAAKFDRMIARVQSAGDALTPAEAALQNLDKDEGARQREQALALAQATGDAEQIRQAQLAIQRAALEERAAVERSARDNATAVRVAALEAAKAQELQNLTERRDQLATKLDEQLVVLQTKLANHPGAYAANQKAIVALLNKFGIDYKTAGENLGKAFAKGIEAAQDDVRKAARSLAKILDDNWHVHSPTKEGPMATLDTWWKKLPSTLASGLNMGPINASVGAIATPAAAAGGSGGGGGSTTIQLVLDGRVISEVIRKDLIAVARRNGSALGGLA